jgi:hypothetical protein
MTLELRPLQPCIFATLLSFPARHPLPALKEERLLAALEEAGVRVRRVAAAARAQHARWRAHPQG